MLVALNTDFRTFLVSSQNDDARWLIIEAIIFLGAFFSIFNAFVNRKKASFEKSLMLMFAIFSNMCVGLYALLHWWDPGNHPLHFQQYAIMFNLFYTLLLMALLRAGVIDDSSILDENVPHYQVMMVTLPIALTYAYCQLMMNASWYITYSWCVFAGLISKDVMRFVAAEVLFFRGTAANSQKEDAHHGI
jgi:uncharacterized RDD family membrane protein YckC